MALFGIDHFRNYAENLLKRSREERLFNANSDDDGGEYDENDNDHFDNNEPNCDG
jgi:hypothetical protein